MSLYNLIVWNQVDILLQHFKKDHVHMRIWTRLYGSGTIPLRFLSTDEILRLVQWRDRPTMIVKSISLRKYGWDVAFDPDGNQWTSDGGHQRESKSKVVNDLQWWENMFKGCRWYLAGTFLIVYRRLREHVQGIEVCSLSLTWHDNGKHGNSIRERTHTSKLYM